MRWFKHMTRSNRDEKLAQLEAEFGLEGYGAYWKVLEAIAEKMDEKKEPFLELPIKNWRTFVSFSPKKLQKFLTFCSEIELFFVKISQKSIRVECPNLLKYRDEHTRNKSAKLRSDSGATQVQDIDTDTDTDTDPNVPPSPPGGTKRDPIPRPEEVTQQVWDDFLNLRQRKKAPFSQTALALIRSEANKAGYSLEQAMETCCANGWQGFRASYVKDKYPSSEARGTKSPPSRQDWPSQAYLNAKTLEYIHTGEHMDLQGHTLTAIAEFSVNVSGPRINEVVDIRQWRRVDAP